MEEYDSPTINMEEYPKISTCVCLRHITDQMEPPKRQSAWNDQPQVTKTVPVSNEPQRKSLEGIHISTGISND